MNNGIEGLDRVFSRINRLHDRITRDIEKPFKASGTYMVGSIQRNFQAEGRPKKWTALADSTIERRRRGKGKGGVKILTDTAAMKNSMAMKLQTDGVEVGTGAIQAKRQHYGYPGGTGRGRSKTPARPFVMIQDEDRDVIAKIFSRHVRS